MRRWVELAQIDRGEKGGLTTDERDELARLRRENRVLKEEREILKKAAVNSARQRNTSCRLRVIKGLRRSLESTSSLPSPAPRIHFVDDTAGATGKIHVGWFGHHLDNDSKS